MTDGLWGFSLRVYARPGVKPACLEIQDGFGLDVNMVLLCCWVAGFGRIGPDELAAALDRSEAWAEAVVRPLRTIRTGMKGAGGSTHDPEGHEELRSEIKAAELRAERFQLEMLEGLAAAAVTDPSTTGAAAAHSHLDAYLDICSCAEDRRLSVLLDVVVDACEPEWSRRSEPNS